MTENNKDQAGPGPVMPNLGPEAQPLYRRIKWPVLLYMLEIAGMYRITGITLAYIYSGPAVKDPLIILILWLGYTTVGSDALTNLMKIYYGVQNKTQVELKKAVLEIRVLWLIIILISTGPYIIMILTGNFQAIF